MIFCINIAHPALKFPFRVNLNGQHMQYELARSGLDLLPFPILPNNIYHLTAIFSLGTPWEYQPILPCMAYTIPLMWSFGPVKRLGLPWCSSKSSERSVSDILCSRSRDSNWGMAGTSSFFDFLRIQIAQLVFNFNQASSTTSLLCLRGLGGHEDSQLCD